MRRELALLATTVALLVSSSACGGSDGADATPKAALSASKKAQLAFRPIAQRWASGTREERVALVPALEAFRGRFHDDDLARTASALLAWASVERGDLGRAEQLASSVRAAGPGSNADVALLVAGAVHRRRGRPAEALGQLVPLVGKLIDPWARGALDEEVVLAALAAKRWPDAIRYMRIWLREAADDDRGGVGKRIETLVNEIPEAELVRALDRGLASRDESPDARRLHTAITQRLARLARERRDVPLAQRLLATAGSLLGEQGDAVAELASGANAARLDPQTVGLLISLRGADARRRGAELAAGIAHGLGLPGGPARLATRDDGGSLEGVDDALANLSADGAAVVVAGTDAEEAAIAARFAESRRIPVLLLRPPPRPPSAPFVFVVGDDPAEGVRLLRGAVAGRGAQRVAIVGGETDAQATDAADGSFRHGCDGPWPVADWKAAGVRAMILLGGPTCSRNAMIEANRVIGSMVFGLGWDAASDGTTSGAVALVSGTYPIGVSATVPSIRAWLDAKGVPPSWWAGLGHDAGVLAWQALKALPREGTDKPTEVQARRAAAAAALLKVRGQLWTTTAPGFEGARVLPRQVSVRELR
jgi:hypothetical protein